MQLYTDGSFSSKTNNGGWAVVDPTFSTIFPLCYGSEQNTTNNRMEMMALIAALKHTLNWNLTHMMIEPHTIYTDSAYLANCFAQKWYVNWRANGWKNSAKKPVANKDLWEQILELYEAQPNTTIEKINGHSGETFNELADSYAVLAREGKIQL